MGQMQVALSTSSDHGAPDNRMPGRNETALPVLRFTWQADGSLFLTALTRFRDQMMASPFGPGMVQLSTGTSPVAVADDDPRMTDQ